MFMSGNSGLQWLRDRLAKKQGATLAVAFWGAGAADALGLTGRDANSPPLRIICNLAMGGTNPHAIEELLKLPGVVVEQSDRLHAKLYLFDDCALIGSSNVSANGLSFEGPLAQGWHEANLLTSDTRIVTDAKKWIAKLPVRHISQQDLKRARLVWKARRQNASAINTNQSIIELLHAGPAAVSGQQTYLTLTCGEWSKEAAKAVKKARKEHQTIDAWEDWPELPREGSFVCFGETSRNIFEFEDCYRRISEFPDRPESKGRYSLQWCFEVPTPLGLKHPNKDKKAWKKVIAKALDHFGSVDKSESRYIPFEDLSALFV